MTEVPDLSVSKEIGKEVQALDRAFEAFRIHGN
jgi:hypothetical protein